MIKTLIDIGKQLRDLYPLPLVEVPYPSQRGKNKPMALVVSLNTISDNTLEPIDISLEDYKSEDALKKYFFRKPPSSHGAAASLSFKLPGKPSALRERLGIIKVLGYKADIEKVADFIEVKLEELRKSGGIAKNTPILVVLKIDDKWPSENEKLREVFKDKFLERLATYKGKSLWKKQGICHGCGKHTTVYGGVGELFRVYTVDKYGYAPMLNPKVSWKQYALCEECILDFERGNRAIDDFLTWNFYGKSFWLLPVASENLRDILTNFKSLHAELDSKVHKEGFKASEDYLLFKASQESKAFSYHFVFTQKEQQATRIRLHIEEVLPSVLARYIKVKNEVEHKFNEIAYEATGKGEFHFNFLSHNSLKATPQKPGFSEEDFYMFVDRVFRRSPMNERYLLSKGMARIRKELAESSSSSDHPWIILPWWPTLELLLSLEFLLKWGILKRKIGGVNMRDLPYQEFFESHGDFFNHPAKRGLVLFGVLVQKFLNEQYNRRGSTPFLKVLKNLRLNQKDVQSVFVALQNKMNEYEIGHWWPELREGISVNFIEAGDTWPLSPDEIGFYMAVGMSLYRHPSFGKDTEKNEE